MCALDRGFVRDGWLVFNPNEEVWGVPLPLKGKAFRVGRWWDCVPAPNPRTIWLAGPVQPDPDVGPDIEAPTVLEEYDGVRGETVATLELEAGVGLEAATPEGLVIKRGESSALLLLQWGSRDAASLAEGDVVSQRGSLLALTGRRQGTDRLDVLDVAARRELEVAKPVQGQWGMFGSFSPDGRLFAISIDGRDRSRVDPFTALNPPGGSSLVLVDCSRGSAATVNGLFIDFGTAPVWSSDSRWLVFNAPFDKSLFVCDVEANEPTLRPVVRQRGRPGPLIDVTSFTTPA
jgi:hypothetical protein